MAETKEKLTEGLLDKVNSNETVKKIKEHKHYKWIKLGALVLAIVLVLLLVGGLFGDKKAKNAEKYIKTEIVSLYEEAGYKKVKVKTKTVAKNKDSHLYLVDTQIKSKDSDGEKETETMFFLVYSDGNDEELLNTYEYTKGNKKDIKEVAIAALSKG